MGRIKFPPIGPNVPIVIMRTNTNLTLLNDTTRKHHYAPVTNLIFLSERRAKTKKPNPNQQRIKETFKPG